MIRNRFLGRHSMFIHVTGRKTIFWMLSYVEWFIEQCLGQPVGIGLIFWLFDDIPVPAA